MNERFKDLINQVGTDVSGKWISVDNADRLADLIVFECIKIAVFKGDSATGKAIKEHFGVAEREDPVQDSNLHTCPYAEEIHGDYETLCDCDEERTRQCAMDV
jgi:hypothetical protein